MNRLVFVPSCNNDVNHTMSMSFAVRWCEFRQKRRYFRFDALGHSGLIGNLLLNHAWSMRVMRTHIKCCYGVGKQYSGIQIQFTEPDVIYYGYMNLFVYIYDIHIKYISNNEWLDWSCVQLYFVPNRSQAIISNSDGLVCWRVYASIGLNE